MASLRRSQLRQQRRVVFAEWRAVPFARRREVLRLAKSGQRHPDEATAQAAQRYATFVTSPSDRWHHSARVREIAAWIVLVFSPVFAAEAWWLHRLDAPAVLVWLVAVVAVAVLAVGLYWIDLIRDSRHILALSPAQTD